MTALLDALNARPRAALDGRPRDYHRLDTAAFWRAARRTPAGRATRRPVEVLRLRFTHTGDIRAGYAEIAAELGVGEQRARALVRSALQRVRRYAAQYTSATDNATLCGVAR